MQACFLPADILLPDAAADFEKWAVVACDQFTSQPEYWRKAAEIVGDAPSTLNLVYPEAYLAEGDARIAAIRQAMEDYMRRGVLQTRVKDGFVLVRRVTESGERSGWSAGWIWSSMTSRPARTRPSARRRGRFSRASRRACASGRGRASKARTR